MTTQQAVESLWKAGFHANASTVYPNSVVVLDPVVVLSGSERRIEHLRVTLHTSQVAKFLVERS